MKRLDSWGLELEILNPTPDLLPVSYPRDCLPVVHMRSALLSPFTFLVRGCNSQWPKVAAPRCRVAYTGINMQLDCDMQCLYALVDH